MVKNSLFKDEKSEVKLMLLHIN